MTTRIAWLGLSLTLACSGVPVRPHASVVLPADLESRGERIYVGHTFPLKNAGPDPLFVYERRVETLSDGRRSTHITRTPEGVIALAEQATHDERYELLEYALLTDQQGQTGSIHVGPDEVTLTLAARSRVERRAGPVVVGPTLVGFLVTRLAALRAGQTLSVRFAVLERLETLGFELRAVDDEAGHTRVRMKPESALIGLVVEPILFTFDDASEKLLRIEGRVPPKRVVDGRLYDLDARVEYHFVAAAYR
jgi:hypothetical protein